MRTHVLGHVLQVLDALPCGREGQFGRLKLLAHIAGTQSQLKSAAGEITNGGHVSRQQRRLVETGVEDERPDPQRGGGRRGRHEGGKRRRSLQVVRQVQDIEAEILDAARRLLNRRLRLGGVQADTEPEVFDHHPILGADPGTNV